VFAIIFFPLGFNAPVSSSVSRKRFWSVRKNPGAMALQRMPTGATCTAYHWVKLLIAPLAAEYAGIFVRGRIEFIDEMFRTFPFPASSMSLVKTIVASKVPLKLRSNTRSKPDRSRP